MAKRKRRRKIKDMVLRRMASIERTALNIDKVLNEWMTAKYMHNIRIPKYLDDGSIEFKPYNKNDMILDMVIFFEIMAKTILEDEELQKAYPYPYKKVSPFNMLRYLKKYGVISFDEYDEVLLNIENIEGE